MRLPLAAGLAVLALAAAPPPGRAAGKTAAVPDTTVLMSPVVLPVVADGRVVNYIFVTLRLGLSRNADSARLRAMEPYFRDALVRAAHRTPFDRPDTYTALDDARLKQSLIQAAARIAGPGQVVSVQIVREQPQHVAGLPRPGASAPSD